MSCYIAFPIEYVGDDSIQAFMTIDTVTTPTTPSRVILEDYGQLEWSYNVEDRFMVPGEVTITIKDLEHELSDILFGSNFTDTTEQKIKLEIRVNTVVDFIGYALEDGINYDVGERELTIRFAPQLDKLNKQMIVDEDNKTNHFFPYDLSGQIYYPLTTILTDFFQLVNPAVTYSSGKLLVSSDWSFKGQAQGGALHSGFGLADLKIDARTVFDIDFRDHGKHNCGAILRSFAESFGCFTGMIHQDKAFFYKLYFYNSSNLQSVNVINYSKQYSKGTIDWVRVTDGIGNTASQGTFTNLENKYIEQQPGIIYSFAYYLTQWTITTNLTADYGGQQYYIYGASDPIVSGGVSIEPTQLLADWWYYWRNKKSRTRVDSFTLNGIGYDFLKNFNYDGNKYQIFSMKKNLSEGTTEVEAFYLGSL